MFKTKSDKLSTIFAILSGAMFLGAVASAILLSSYGMYIALALIFFGGFSTLVSAMIMERSRTRVSANLDLLDEDQEEEALL